MSADQSLDELVARARPLLARSKDASTSRLARQLGVSWQRAAAVLERLEEEGVVSRPDRNGRRNVRKCDGSLIQPAGKPWRAWEEYALIVVRWIARQRGRDV